MHGADRLDHFLGGRALDDVAGGARFQRPTHVLPLGVHGKHDHAALGIVLDDGARRVRAVQLRHRKVHQHHVRLRFLGDAHRLAAVADDGDDLQVFLRLDQVLQALGHHRVVVGNEDADGHFRKVPGR